MHKHFNPYDNPVLNGTASGGEGDESPATFNVLRWIMDVLAVLIKVVPLLLHIVLSTILLHNKNRYLSNSFYILIFILSITVIIETTSTLVAMLLESSHLRVIYLMLTFLEYFTDSYTPCVVLLIGLNQMAVFSRGFLHYYVLKTRNLLINALILFGLAVFWSFTLAVVPYLITTTRGKKTFAELYIIISCIFHSLPILSFMLYLIAYVKMRSLSSSSVLPATTYQFIMRVERINLIQGFFVSLAYTISSVCFCHMLRMISSLHHCNAFSVAFYHLV
ncbi:hypothetical protein Y032_0002g1103 [Ancylostoma ceylanicum]|uniref:G-protein coupled receptors family 1 profile domain-containing protein n=3 Tax=Ancylostoma ceylanicum TaxID=53326 RepID=A0A016W0I7_9BILA|nr:hypothetical protein Y032_0002g1103 [Ancylostoma ceylanicum]